MPLLQITAGEKGRFTINNIWVMVATSLVFITYLGLATVESGVCQ